MKSMLSALVLATCTLVAVPAVQAKPADESKSTAKAAPKVFKSPQKEGTKATCPVTGEEFVIAKDTAHAEHKGQHVYFCCPSCHKPFDKEPGKYVK